MKQIIFLIAIIALAVSCTDEQDAKKELKSLIYEEYGPHAKVEALKCEYDWYDEDREYNCTAIINGVRSRFKCEVEYVNSIFCY